MSKSVVSSKSVYELFKYYNETNFAVVQSTRLYKMFLCFTFLNIEKKALKHCL